MTPSRVLVIAEGAVASYPVRPDEDVVLGRDPSCDVWLPLKSVSRRHARLKALAEGMIAVEDLGGMDGVRIRGARAPKGQSVPVRAGDVIELGGVVVLIHAQDATTPLGVFARPTADRSSHDDPMRAFERLLEAVGESDLDVVVCGEAGIGKRHAADLVHSRSPRAGIPMVRIDGSSPTAESALSAAISQRGTIALRNAGDLPSEVQSRLASLPRRARIISTDEKDVAVRVTEGTMQRALYDSLAHVRILLSPLRERTNEIPRLAMKFLFEAARRMGRPPPQLSNEALGVLVHHPFRGNLRELRTAMERACILAGRGFRGGGYIGIEHLLFDNDGTPMPTTMRTPLARARPLSQTEPPRMPTDAPSRKR